MDPQKTDAYHSYLLRLWQERMAGQPIWRASLQSTKTGRRYTFLSLDNLIAFLYDRTNQSATKNQRPA